MPTPERHQLKKSTVVRSAAALGASVLGIVGAAAGAVPAQAATPTALPDCTDYLQHTVSASAVPGSNWYMDCVPQYGAGKAEFTVISDVDFPADFLDLHDPEVTVTSTTAAPAVAGYFGVSTTIGGFSRLYKSGGVDPRMQQYTGTAYLPISSVAAIDPTTLPAACVGTYNAAYQITYAPATTTFTQSVDGEEWKYEITAAPEPLSLGMNLANTGGIDSAQALCASSAGATRSALNNSDGVWDSIMFSQVERGDTFIGTNTLSPAPGDWTAAKNLGTFSRWVAPVVVVPPVVTPPVVPPVVTPPIVPPVVAPPVVAPPVVPPVVAPPVVTPPVVPPVVAPPIVAPPVETVPVVTTPAAARTTSATELAETGAGPVAPVLAAALLLALGLGTTVFSNVRRRSRAR
jgi:hypothetical protein